MPKAKAKADYALAQNELYATKSVSDLESWGKKNANRIETFPPAASVRLPDRPFSLPLEGGEARCEERVQPTPLANGAQDSSRGW